MSCVQSRKVANCDADDEQTKARNSKKWTIKIPDWLGKKAAVCIGIVPIK
jgi:hypothetical protein